MVLVTRYTESSSSGCSVSIYLYLKKSALTLFNIYELLTTYFSFI